MTLSKALVRTQSRMAQVALVVGGSLFIALAVKAMIGV